MDFTMLIAAFGGGLLATFFGGITAFVFTGLTVFAAVMGGAAGAPAISIISFGSWFGPHISFAGAVAGAAFAMTRNHIENGQDIVTPLVKFGDPMVLIVGGIFGMIGFLIQYVVGPVIGPVLFNGILGDGAAGWTDTVAFTVVISAIIVRLVFGKTGLTGKTPAGEKRQWVSTGSRLGFILTYGFGIGILIGGIAAKLGTLGLVDGVAEAAYMFSLLPVLGFAVAAISLILIMCGHAFEGWHHIVLPAGSTAVILFSATLNPFAAIIGGAITGMITAFIGEWAAKTFNSFADTHIDPPACTIFIMQTINFVVLGGLILG
ncbi:hypothetical protein [Acetobacterium bakii]|uniref:DUF7973 domain-containing protein n=1 Tax=Acetobacterium bakii TaxID=52689 RepID=A0A0L6U0N2_9FIRM|nr:hypothetical protein [Acetobacterium bakii]KNZ41350.1 hypothetical protein AKG39_12050 [Acetobacterium bakii]